MRDAGPRLLLADIGGTHARFMLAAPAGALPPPRDLPTKDFPAFGAALKAFLRGAARRPKLDAVAVAAAGPVIGGAVKLTNCPWTITRQALAVLTGVAAPVLVNDFAAQAMGVAALGPRGSRPIGPARKGAAQAPIGVIGPGTGLGVAALVPDGRGDYRVVAGEGGHVDLAASDAREDRVLALLRRRFQHVSAERVLSGPGLEHLHAALCARDGVADPKLSAARIAEAARAGAPRAREAIALFTAFLGAVAGNLALTLGARGGIFLTGGILPRWGELFDGALFRARFEAKGRAAPYLARIPTRLVLAPDVAFLGLRRLALAAQ